MPDEYEGMAATATADDAGATETLAAPLDDGADQGETQAAAYPDTASGGETPAPDAETAQVPSWRLREEADQRREAERQLEEVRPFLSSLQLMGLTPEQAFQHLAAAVQTQQQGAAVPEQQSPEDLFAEYLLAKGHDPYVLEETDPALFNALAARHGMEQLQQQLQQQQQAAQVQQQEAARANEEHQARIAVEASLVQARQQYPAVYGVPALEQAMLGRCHALAQTGATVNVAAEAAKFATEIEAMVQSRINGYAASKAQDGRAPVTAGGSAPPAVDRPDINTESTSERRSRITGILQAMTARP